MSIKPFRASVIKKVSDAKSRKFFEKLEHKYHLIEEAGSRGFSNLQMDKKLKEMGYDPKRRKAVISHILGGKGTDKKNVKLSMEDIAKLTKEDIEKLPGEERKRIAKINKAKTRRNIAAGRYSSEQGEQEQTHAGMIGVGQTSGLALKKKSSMIVGGRIKGGQEAKTNLHAAGESNIAGFASNLKKPSVNSAMSKPSAAARPANPLV